jgi:hypothetical protein
MRTITRIVRVTNVWGRNVSIYGNPSCWVEFMDGNDLIKGYTGANNACGVTASNYVNKLCKMTNHKTCSGNYIIDFMRNPT